MVNVPGVVWRATEGEGVEFDDDAEYLVPRYSHVRPKRLQLAHSGIVS